MCRAHPQDAVGILLEMAGQHKVVPLQARCCHRYGRRYCHQGTGDQAQGLALRRPHGGL
ncbi:hypothetical protein D3C85_1747900 [compost metagenome]